MPRKKSTTYTKSDCKRVLYIYAYKKIPVALYKTILSCIDSYFEKKNKAKETDTRSEVLEVNKEETKQLDLFDFKI